MIGSARSLVHKAAIGLAALAVCGTAVAQDSDDNHVMFILDASNSMWGQVDGRAKIEIAKEVLANQFAALPDGTQAGLIAYGHRFARELNECTDMELVGGYGSYAASDVQDMLDYIVPKGQTPIAATLEEAVAWATVDSNNEPVSNPTVVLITDGVESCSGDPCAAAAALADAGVNTTLHVVGFDLSAEQSAEVQCIAENGGGRYLDASDSAGLDEALKQVGVEIVQAEIVPEPEPEPAPPAEPVRQSVYVENFDGASFVENWTVKNEALDSYIVEAGELLAINTAVGGFDVGDTRNLFTLDSPLPDGDWDAEVTFTTEFKTGRDRFQFGLWADAENSLVGTLWTERASGSLLNACSFIALSNTKQSGGEATMFDMPVRGAVKTGCGNRGSGFDYEASVEALTGTPLTMTLHKRGRAYHISANLGELDENDEPVIYETEPLTSLRAPGTLAFAVGKWEDAQGEVAVMVDKVEIFTVPQ
ncbi:MAG: VWA domain-containing protein [Hoeflea sp. D1-CHI-28]